MATIPRFQGQCNGCGRVEPCGIHYDDCPLLDDDDLIVPRQWAGTSRDSDNGAMTLSQFTVWETTGSEVGIGE